jgi:hypothetical protein
MASRTGGGLHLAQNVLDTGHLAASRQVLQVFLAVLLRAPEPLKLRRGYISTLIFFSTLLQSWRSSLLSPQIDLTPPRVDPETAKTPETAKAAENIAELGEDIYGHTAVNPPRCRLESSMAELVVLLCLCASERTS